MKTLMMRIYLDATGGILNNQMRVLKNDMKTSNES